MIAVYVVAAIALLIIVLGAWGGGSTPDVPWLSDEEWAQCERKAWGAKE